MKDRFGFDWNNIPGTLFWRNPQIGRRLFFRHAASAVGGYFLLPTRPMETVARAAQPIAKAKNAIFILQSGGASHTDLFDLKEGSWLPANYNPTSFGGLRLAQGLLPTVAQHTDSLAVVRSVRSWALVHDLARAWAQILRNPANSLSRIAPHIGSVAAIELGQSNQILPAFVALNTGTDTPGNGYFPPTDAPFFVSSDGGLTNTSNPNGQGVFDRRYSMLANLDASERAAADIGPAIAENVQFNVSAKTLMYNSAVNTAFTVPAADRTRYGASAFASACVTARNLLRAKLGTRFILITTGGWDNHAGIYTGPLNAGNAASVGRQFDAGLGNLIADLKADGTLEDTLIFGMGEFGRTTGPLNSGAGRDHYLQQTAFFAGAGIRGPKVIGSTDSLGRNTTDPGWGRDRDVRPEDIGATVYSALGIDWTTVRRDDPIGRGFEYIPFAASQDLYGPIHELWG